MDENELKGTVAKNISKYRKHSNLTQLELAEKLNYSDKAVSKWERGEAMPDVFILKSIATLFKISVDDLLCDNPNKKIYIGISVEKRVIVPIISVLLIFLAAIIIFGILIMQPAFSQKAWLAFVYAIPASAACTFIFGVIWKKGLLTAISASLFVWSAAVSLFYSSVLESYDYLFFIIASPCQIIIILWHVMVGISQKRKEAR
jgi:transcriptional regulator with XRE-family HTH domain